MSKFARRREWGGGSSADVRNAWGPCWCSLYWDAKTRKVSGLNGSGRSPQGLTLEEARRRGLDGGSIPGTDLNA